MILSNSSMKTLSILIPTIEGREQYLKALLENINVGFGGIEKLRPEVEILTLYDRSGENSIGAKRNKLLAMAKGEFVQFVDDDDLLSPEYFKLAIPLLKATSADCMELSGEITFDGINPKPFLHSIRYSHWYEEGGVYYRPPNHLNPIRASIAKTIHFPDISHGEDREWSMKLSDAKLLASECSIGIPYYFYQYRTYKTH